MNAMNPKSIGLLLFLLVALMGLGLAQAIGYWVNETIPRYTTVELTSLIHLTHIRNFGGVFGMFQGNGWWFAGFSVLLLGGITAYLLRTRVLPRAEYLCFGCIAGGGASNIADRLIYGSVIDYINVQHLPWWPYIFNMADVLIHLGIWAVTGIKFAS